MGAWITPAGAGRGLRQAARRRPDGADAALAGGAQSNLAKLQRTDPQQLGKLLDSEHPQTIALVLAHLDPKRASIVLDNLSEEHKVVSIQRLAEMRQFSRRWRRRWRMILHKRLESVGDTARRSYSGFKAVPIF